jgi:hypothetical protein
MPIQKFVGIATCTINFHASLLEKWCNFIISRLKNLATSGAKMLNFSEVINKTFDSYVVVRGLSRFQTAHALRRRKEHHGLNVNSDRICRCTLTFVVVHRRKSTHAV